LNERDRCACQIRVTQQACGDPRPARFAKLAAPDAGACQRDTQSAANLDYTGRPAATVFLLLRRRLSKTGGRTIAVDGGLPEAFLR
jgi:hypothetical protein